MNKKIKPNLHGPESIPIKDYVKSFPMLVTVYNGDEVMREELIDYGQYEHRKWIGRVTFWAVSQGFVVETSKPE